MDETNNIIDETNNIIDETNNNMVENTIDEMNINQKITTINETNNDNTIIFTIARMNPPTPGHLYLIQQLIEQAIIMNVDEVYIILSKTIDVTNPIKCNDKQLVLGDPNDTTTTTMINSLKKKMIEESYDPLIQNKINNIKVIPICVPEDVKGATPFTVIFTLIGSKPPDIPNINLFLIIGKDRSDMIQKVKQAVNKIPIVKVDGKVLERENMEDYKNMSLDELSNNEIPTNAMSASLVRNIVEAGKIELFNNIYSPYLEPEQINELYDKIKYGLLNNTTKQTKQTKLKQSKKPINDESIQNNELIQTNKRKLKQLQNPINDEPIQLKLRSKKGGRKTNTKTKTKTKSKTKSKTKTKKHNKRKN
jgi:nicotinic acid mononucleotide adenylyltransferase